MTTNTSSIAAPKVDFAYLPSLNFALHQNHVPIIRELTVTNTSGTEWTHIEIEITSEPAFTIAWKQTLEVLKPGETHSFKQIPLRVSAKYLAELTERLSGNFIITLKAGGQQIFQEFYKVDLLAYDQWNGTGLLPEMLAAFITPNHPEIPNIIRKASAILGKWTGSPSFDEYQSRNPDRVRKQMAAIYEAIASLQLIYCSVPASFEETGQRIRMASEVFSNKLANCLDISLLFTACLEAVGIHPLVIMVKGHAFVGAWLIEESFADTINDDPSLITKRTADGINEIALVEATCMNAGHQIQFDDAVRSADEKISTDFNLFIDIKRARFSGIRPMPLRMATPSGWEIITEETAERESILPGDIFVGPALQHADKIEVTKQRLWERKLLDLTLRNSLLNVRMTKSIIQFMTINVGLLEDALAKGDEFQVLAKPTDWDNPLRDTGLYRALNQSDPVADLVKHELTHKRIRSYLPEAEVNAALLNVYRSSRLSLEENGANTLYIGLGFLKWYETDLSEKPRYAPVLLIPVEIIRKSAQRGFVIRSREEETIMNITLLEMIRQDFGISIGGLETLPKDENGVDVKGIFNIMRQAVMAKSRWDVEEQAILGTFSFSKFILWNDIHHNADKLAKNKVVASLMSGKLEWTVEENASTKEILDSALHPATVALPISTDSSQLHAIVSSGQNKSFVLHGPPGTGKSQTITNIIANALYNGKRVLFVAAKKAALDVVESRLESIGIGPFCLELHSNKSKKSAVLEQLKVATEIVQRAAPANFQEEADRLFQLRNELNIYVEALHQKHPSGYSLFDLFTEYSKLPEDENHVRFPASSIENITATQLTAWQDLAKEMQMAGEVIGHPHKHPLGEITIGQYTSQVKQEAKQGIEQFIVLLKQSGQEIEVVRSLLKLDGFAINREQEKALNILIGLLLNLSDVPASLFQTDALEQTLAQLIGIAAHGKERDLLRGGLLTQFQKSILNLPAQQTLTQWQMAEEKWFLPRWLEQRKLGKSLRQLSLNGQVNKEEVPDILQRIIAYQREHEFIDKATQLPALLGFLWNNGDVNWDEIIKISETLIEINRTAGAITMSSQVSKWRNQLATEFSEGSKYFFSVHRKTLEEYLAISQELRKTEHKLQNILGVNFDVLHRNSDNRREDLLATASLWLSNIESLKDWHNWINIKDRGLKAGLAPLVAAFETGSIQGAGFMQQFHKGVYQSIAENIIAQSPQLATFNGTLFSEKIKRFREISANFEVLTRQELYARLAAKIPSFTQEASQSSEIGILQKAIRNNGRAMSIRKIFDSIPNLLPRLTPCMLMSPISVAQYFDADSIKFDLVIFDEASQMPTSEAVGAIARGSNVIVVGDPKQMPPTSFFTGNNIDEENIDKEDLESILDDCLALSMPSQHLLWHYRSKHESLIAFSNSRYYDNKLLTFPSTDDITSKVQFVRVEGFYDKGKTRQNAGEAKAIVGEIVRRLSDPLLSKRSMGIVTFSSVQQTLVEDLLTETFILRPDLEKIALECKEPLFIKNLENVQGDERDIILFSIGYGPDQEGKVSLNFGPINREGGWRRLNVAVSRARYEMKVFSTLRSDQIDLNRTSSQGVAGLKAFLAYAEKGKASLGLPAPENVRTGQSLETIIAAEIRKMGYGVETHIGCSAFKIDIAIVDPSNPSQYILGILTDGNNYYNAVTTKDREIIQVDVLSQLGWEIHKIWSTEWWENRGKVMDGIRVAIQQAEENKKKSEQIAAESKVLLPQPPLLNEQFSQPVTKTAETSSAVIYEVSRLEMISLNSTEEFFMLHNQAVIKAQINTVLETESPISKELLCKRVLGAWGISRLSTRVSNHFETLFVQMKLGAKAGFFWKRDSPPSGYTIYRIAKHESQKRDADDLPPEEVANAVREVLKNQISLSRSDLIRETSRVFGFARLGANVESAMTHGITLAVERGMAAWDGERVIYAG